MAEKRYIGIDFGTDTIIVSKISSGEKKAGTVLIDGDKFQKNAIAMDEKLNNFCNFGTECYQNSIQLGDRTFINYKMNITEEFIGKCDKNIKVKELFVYAFNEIKKHLEDEIGYNPEKDYFVIGIPALWNEVARRNTLKYAKEAGFKNLELLEEPIAAYKYFLNEGKLSLKSNENVLVYDLGGGTCDISIVRHLNDKVFSETGGEILGGRDFDKALLDYFYKKDIKNNLKDEKLYEKEKNKILLAIQKLKERLSLEVKEGNIGEDEKIVSSTEPLKCLGGDRLKLKISKSEFEIVCSNLIDKLIKPIEIALQQHSIWKSDINKIIITGGTSNFWFIEREILNFFHALKKEDILKTTDSMLDVSKGLAISHRYKIYSKQKNVYAIKLKEGKKYCNRIVLVDQDRELPFNQALNLELSGQMFGKKTVEVSIDVLDYNRLKHDLLILKNKKGNIEKKYNKLMEAVDKRQNNNFLSIGTDVSFIPDKYWDKYSEQTIKLDQSNLISRFKRANYVLEINYNIAVDRILEVLFNYHNKGYTNIKTYKLNLEGLANAIREE